MIIQCTTVYGDKQGENKMLLVEPFILSANCYFWKPSSNAAGRRNNEKRRNGEVDTYLLALGFTDTGNGYVMEWQGKEISVSFSYEESCHNVYKHLSVCVDGKKSNISTIRKIHKSLDVNP
jgi:hypothetical protein